MSRIEFGIYYIPEQESTFYQKGSEIVGYDIRKEKRMPAPEFEGFWLKDGWRKFSRQYGLHMTLTDVVSINSEKLSEIINQVSRTVKNLASGEIEMKASGVDYIDSGNTMLGTLIEKTYEIQLLHNELVRLQKYGDSTLYTRKIQSQPDWIKTLSPEQQKNLKEYMSPYILREYFPHFTFLNPVDNMDKQMLEKINSFIGFPISFKIQSISVVGRNIGEDFFKVYEEIPIVS